MKKTYIYEKKYFNIEVQLTGIISIVGIVISIYMILNQQLAPLFTLLFIVTLYQALNTFVTNSNPQVIEISSDSITLSSFMRKDTYYFKDIHTFKVREFPKKAKAYVRINQSSFYKGRYWIQTIRMKNGDELFDWLVAFEVSKHPDSLKAKALKSHQKK